MLVKLDPNVTIQEIAESWYASDQYDILGDLTQETEDGMQAILDAIKDQDLTLMELMHTCQAATDDIWVGFIPVRFASIDGINRTELTHPTLLFSFDDIPCDLAVIQMEDHYWITLEYVI